MLIRIQRKFDKEITVVDIQMKDLNEQIKIFELEKARLCQQMNSIKEATKSDANSFEERLKVVLIQSEKNKEEMYKQAGCQEEVGSWPVRHETIKQANRILNRKI